MTAAPVRHATFVIERAFAASPARVFAAWTDPAQSALWDYSGPDWAAAQDTADVRVGGRKVSRFGPPGDLLYTEETTFLDIVEERRLVFAYTVARRGERITASLATVEFAPGGGGTNLTVTEQLAILDGQDSAGDRERGWGEALDKLAALIARTTEPA